jgi:hypothetical protein
MKLLNTLLEASPLEIPDIKKVMSKDDRVKILFKKGSTLEDVQNKDEFLKTVKFFLLNNPNVIEFVKDRDDIKTLFTGSFKELRKLKVSDLSDKSFSELQNFVSALFKEHTSVSNSVISQSVRKEINDWVNADVRYFNLSSGAQKELQTIPNIRGTKPVVLYRGLLFNSYDLKETKRYDGQLEIGKGLKFLRSIREGKRIVDLEWDRPSSWSTSKDVATQFAKFGPASSSFSATAQWLNREGAIDGDLGFIISTLAKPEDVLVDVNLIPSTAHRKHGDEGEIILKPGNYTCRVFTKYSKDGEVDLSKSTDNDSIPKAIQDVKSFNKTWMAKTGLEEFVSSSWRNIDIARLIREKDFKKFKDISSIKTKEKVLEEYDKLKEFYKDHLSELNSSDLVSLVGTKDGRILGWIKDLSKRMNGTHKSKDFVNPKNSSGRVKEMDMSGEQYRNTISTYFSKHLKDTLDSRFTDSSIGGTIRDLYKGFVGTDPGELHRKGKAAQDEAVQEIMKAFFKEMNVTEPSSKEESVKAMSTAFLAATRNASMIDSLMNLKKSLEDALKDIE